LRSSPIAAGAMGQRDSRAALKVLHLELSNRPDVVTRFFNEARAATASPIRAPPAVLPDENGLPIARQGRVE
jgi:hypothetical protein